MRINKMFYLHPSRGRPSQALKTIELFINSMKSGIDFSYVLSLDVDDPTKPLYYEAFESKPWVKSIIENNNDGAVMAANAAAKLITDEDIIFVLADDFEPTPDWDVKLKRFTEDIPTSEYLVHIGDGHEHRDDCAIVQILSTAMYKKLGYIYHPSYKSVYADNDIYMAARVRGWAYTCKDFYILHNHPAWGTAPMDDTYNRESSSESIQVGTDALQRRRACNFGKDEQ